MVMMVPAQSVSFSFVAASSSSLTGQGEDEAHAIYNSSRHGGCVITVSAGGEKFRPETFVESRRWRKGRSCGVYDTAGCAIRCEACSCSVRAGRRGSNSRRRLSTKGGLAGATERIDKQSPGD